LACLFRWTWLFSSWWWHPLCCRCTFHV